MSSERKRQISAAAERNKQPILDILSGWLSEGARVLEIGAGTGQHAEHFAAARPDVIWTMADLPERLPELRTVQEESELSNLRGPVAFDAFHAKEFASSVSAGPFDVVYTANTIHIMPWAAFVSLADSLPELLVPGGIFAAYGPFEFADRELEPSNARFSHMLQTRDPEMGIRRFEGVRDLLERHGIAFVEDNPMPANNRLLQFRRK